MADTTKAVASLRALLNGGEDLESTYQALLEEQSELVPVGLDMLNHDVQWQAVISKFHVTDDREADLAFITKSTDTWRLVMIELERPGRRLFVDNPYADFHGDTRAPVAQVEHWKTAVQDDPRAVRERLRPLVHLGSDWDTNPIEFRYILVTGRNADGRFSKDHAACIERLRNERGIRLMTWDSVWRHAETSRRPRLNVLAHHRGSFRFKRAQAGTLLFGQFHHDQIHLDGDQEAWFRTNGYDIDAWRAGKLLTLNQKYPREKMNEVVARALHALKKPKEK